MALSERDQAILDFERGWWKESGRKEDGIRARLGLSGARYRRLLASLIDDPDAEAVDPLVVRRLRKARDARRRARFEGPAQTGSRGGSGTSGGRSGWRMT